MRLLFSLLLLVFSTFFAIAQDRMVVPTSNPATFQFQREGGIENDKLLIAENEIIYQYDTLELPFVDDFSVNHFPDRLDSLTDPSIIDTTFYRIYQGGMVYRDTTGFSVDTTFTFQINAAGDTISRIPNIFTIIRLDDFSSFPPTTNPFLEVYPPYNIFDTISKAPDTILVVNPLVQDSITFYIVPPDTNDFYTDREVYINNTFAINPPSIGVVTFDGLDEFGKAYGFGTSRISSDAMTSVPINLANLPDTNVYISFYYQPQGIGLDGPEEEDSLVLDFYSTSKDQWGAVWNSGGFSNNDSTISDSIFLQEIVKVPNDFHASGFRFRFRNYAKNAGAFDQWHLDYIYLNNGRSSADTVYKDAAFIKPANTLLKDYYAMPWFHFNADPSLYTADSALALVKNNFNQGVNLFNKVVIPDTIGGGNFYSEPPTAEFINLPANTFFQTLYPITYDFVGDSVTEPGFYEAIYDIRIQVSPNDAPDFIRTNDTLTSRAVLANYYAYDDGTAEAGYGVDDPDAESFMAVRFSTPFRDTIGGILAYFLPQRRDITQQRFKLSVWSGGSFPEQLIFEKEMNSTPSYTNVNGYGAYLFDSLVVVENNFFVGFKTIGTFSLNVGYDLNTNNRDKIVYSFNGGTWFNPTAGKIRDGSLMIRPVFREKRFQVGLSERSDEKPIDFHLYPNPTSAILNIVAKQPNDIQSTEIYDLGGRQLAKFGAIEKIDIQRFPKGIYFLALTDRTGRRATKKFIVTK